MAYVKQTWINGAGGGTPLSADRLNHIEDGIENVDLAKADLSGPLGRWKTKLATSPATAKVVFSGDSTSDAATAAGVMYNGLAALHTQLGEALHGLGPADYVTDGATTNGSTTLTAGFGFTAADVGRYLHNRYITLGTVISAVTNSTTVTLNQAASGTGTDLPTWIGRHIVSGGNNGATLSGWYSNPSGPPSSYPHNRDSLVAENPDLIVYSWLFNDIRQGGLGITVDTIVPAGIALIVSLVEWTRAAIPGADILLRMPNPILTSNVSGWNFVTDGTNINPSGLAQIYSTALRRIYLHFVGLYDHVDVIDIQGEVFGTASLASHPLMTDQLHPSTGTILDVYGFVSRGGGYNAIADAVAARIGFARNLFSPVASRIQHEFIVSAGPSAGQVRLISRDAYGLPASQAPVFATDSLYISGMAGPISLTGCTVDRLVHITILQLTGIAGGADFSPYIGRAAVVIGDHAPMTTQDRQVVYVDLLSIPSGATVTQDVTVTGANSSAFAATAVIAAPYANFFVAGLVLVSAYTVSADTVRLTVQNPTGAAIDQPGENWTFWLVR